MHEANCQQLHHIFVDFFSSQGLNLMFQHFLTRFYNTFLESYIDQEQNQTQKDIYQRLYRTFKEF